jgi:hypothetical protein
MSDLLTKFNYTNQFQDTEEITDAENLTIDLGSEGKNSNFRMLLKNPPVNVFSDGNIQYKWVDNDGIVIFRAIKATKGEIINEELIDIYATYTETDPTQDVESDSFLLFTGIINKGKIQATEASNKIELTGLDRNTIILDKLTIPTAIKRSDNKNSPEIVQQLIRNAGDGVPTDSNAFDFDGNKALGNPFYIDARLFSEGLITSGTADSVSSRTLTDSGATFSSDGVEEQDWVRNTSTNETAFVTNVTETVLTLDKDIFTSTDGYQVSDGFIQDFRPDGTVFPDIAFSQFNKPLLESVEKLSQINSTNTAAEQDATTGTLIVKRGMRWYIDKKNRMHWYVPDNLPKHIIEVGSTSAISPDPVYHRIFKVDKNNETRGNVNYIIFKAGEDMDGDMIMDFAKAKFTGSPIIKDSRRDWLHIARGMKAEDEKAGNISKVGSTVPIGDAYEITAGFPFTPVWDRQERSVDNSTEYNDNFIEEAKLRGKDLSSAVFQKQSNPRWAGQIQIRGEDVLVGDLIQFTSRPQGIRNLLVRVKQVTHSLTGEIGWVTSLRVEEDELEGQVGL